MTLLAPPIDPAARHAIEQLIVEHAWLIDHGQADRVPALFTPDGRMFGVGPDKIGRDAIAAWATARAAMADRRSRHVMSNIRLQPSGPDKMRGTAVLTLFRHDGDGDSGGAGSPAPLMVGEYEDVFQRDATGVWRFAERRLVPLFGVG